MPREYEVVIIGGGPAGLSAGIVLAGQGLHTLVLEQKSFPVDKACGEGVMPVGLKALEKLQVKQKLRPGEYRPFKGVRYYMEGLPAASADFPQGAGWGIRRTSLSDAFIRRAKELNSLEIQSGLPDKARPIQRTDRGIMVQNGDEVIQARLLVGADGLDSRVRHWAKLDGSPSASQRWGVRQHYQVKPWNDYVEVYWNDGMEAYLTPCGEETIGIAILWDRKRPLPHKRGADFFSSLITEFPSLIEKLDGASPLGDTRAVGPLSRKVKGPIADGVILAGDAAGYLDALTGEGISLAVNQAVSMQKTVVPVLKRKSSGIIQGKQLGEYARHLKEMYVPYNQMTGLALFLSRNPYYARLAIQILGKYPRFFQHLLSVNMGQSSLWPGFRKGLHFF
jgi:menaquinone-9 beta-reductase